MISQKEISNKEIIQEVYKLIDENKHLNAFITLNEENSLKKAEALDKNPSDLPLSGIPIAQKDLFCTKGVRTTCASNILNNFIPPYSATVIENLEKADCISIGKTNMDEFAMGSSNETSFFGKCAKSMGSKTCTWRKLWWLCFCSISWNSSCCIWNRYWVVRLDNQHLYAEYLDLNQLMEEFLDGE